MKRQEVRMVHPVPASKLQREDIASIMLQPHGAGVVRLTDGRAWFFDAGDGAEWIALRDGAPK